MLPVTLLKRWILIEKTDKKHIKKSVGHHRRSFFVPTRKIGKNIKKQTNTAHFTITEHNFTEIVHKKLTNVFYKTVAKYTKMVYNIAGMRKIDFRYSLLHTAKGKKWLDLYMLIMRLQHP